ncbi:universal stress protein [Mesobacterium pallidum]|uniref:universal stress protein n=1 Tax=Mesobacterium pallidum TaxID=2872037 RepID=UPI001EE2B56C|nr:universal stress protein [Mesobacterium pallidum]
MTAINTVLCAIDVNRPETETDVLQQAWKLASAEGAQLDVITVVPDYGMSVVGGFFEGDHTSKAVEKVKGMLSALTTAALGQEVSGKIRHLVAVGKSYQEILHVASTDKADLIVLGAHAPDLKDYLLGPTAARVVRHSKTSVYVVR